MAYEARYEDSSASHEVGESSESAVEINVKTLDSQIYKFHINKDISVSTLKAKVANATGIPVEQQRLIFKGKVLKDDHLLSGYHLEDGDTLHLVARQPAQAQPMPGISAADSARVGDAQGNDSMGDASRNRVGQISHSVVLGPVNIADQGEGLIANIGRVVGAVLQSMGGGTPGANNIAFAGNRNQLGNQVQPAVTVVNQPLQVPQLALTGPVPRNMVVPDSLTTLLDFINRIESVLQNSGNQSSAPSSTRDPPRSENLSSELGRLPTPELLALAIEHAQQLLCGNVAAAFSRLVEHLRQEVNSSDAMVRSQIQAEAMHMGVVMQHLGAMLLELGRTTMMLRMGSSHGESFVNAGPALYISSTGPNPIMVQPFIPQTSSLFTNSTPLLGGQSGPFGGGDLLRNINIHVRSGASLATGGTSSGASSNSNDGSRSQQENVERASPSRNGSADAAPRQVMPVRAVVAAIPARSTAETTNHVVSVIYPVHVSSQQSATAQSVQSQSSNPTMGSGIEYNMTAIPNLSSESGSTPAVTQMNASSSSAFSDGALGYSPPTPDLQHFDAQGSPNLLPENPSEVTISGLVTEINEQIVNLLTPTDQSQNSLSRSIQSSTSQGTAGMQPIAADSMSSNIVGNVSVSENDKKNVVAESQVPDVHLQDGKEKQVGEEGNDFSKGEYSRRNLDLEASSIDNMMGLETACQPADKCSIQSLDKFAEKNVKYSGTSQDASSGQDGERPAPLGLGLGGLQPKRRSKPTKSLLKDGTSHVTSAINEESVARGQQMLQSLASQGSDVRSDVNGSSKPFPSPIGPIMNGLSVGHEGARGQLDVGNMMSHVLQNPAFNNLLTNLAEQTGIGSPSDLRSMMEQCTRSPAIRNTLSNIAQQPEGQGQNLGSILMGSGRGQGGVDFSRMIQQMMPMVAQAVDSISTGSTLGSAFVSERQRQSNNTNMTGVTSQEERLHRSIKIDLHEAQERIERHDLPRNIFYAVLEGTEHLYGEGDNYADLVQELGDNTELGNEYVEMLRHHIRKRLENHPRQNEES